MFSELSTSKDLNFNLVFLEKSLQLTSLTQGSGKKPVGNFSVAVTLSDLIEPSYTVGNRVVKSPRSDFFKSYFLLFISIINTPTKKETQKNRCYLQVFRYGLSKWKLQKSCFSILEGSTLDANILGSVRILFNIYIGILVSFPMIYLSKLSVI
jgi:hypothetical protein